MFTNITIQCADQNTLGSKIMLNMTAQSLVDLIIKGSTLKSENIGVYPLTHNVYINDSVVSGQFTNFD